MRRLIDQYPLGRGAHATRDDGMCAMEMVAWLAGEAHSDEPGCACPVLAALVRACNDAMTDDARNRYLRPLVPVLVNSRATAAIEQARGLVALDALVRELLPLRLERQRRPDVALLCRELPAIRRLDDVAAARRAIGTFAPEQRAALWVLDRAREGTRASSFVAGIVQVAKSLDDRATWTSVVRLIERMVCVEPRGADVFAAG